MDRGLTLAEKLFDALEPEVRQRHLAAAAGSWEVGRLVLAPEYRSDPEALKRCLHLAVSYLVDHAWAPHLYATCSHVLSRLYRRFGFNAFATDVPLTGTSRTYALIYGESGRVMQALGRSGSASTCGAVS